MKAFPAWFKKGHQVGHLSRRGLVLDIAVIGICLVANGSTFSFLQILMPLNAISTCSTGQI